MMNCGGNCCRWLRAMEQMNNGGNGVIEEKSKSSELDWGWDLSEPCAECPFRKATPPEKKGIDGEMAQSIWKAAMTDGQFAHSCHRTDARSDYAGAQDYRGKLQMCAGFTMMALRENWPIMPIMRAVIAGKLDRSKLRGWKQVHTWRGLLKAIVAWATA
jgi:hypothetical protein